MPRGVRGPKLTFDRMAAEAGWDGGNVSPVNNGKWKGCSRSAPSCSTVPTHAWCPREAATPTRSVVSGDGGPGTDGGEVAGRQITQVALAKAGVGRGDVLEIRFDFGRDGCNGLKGWYVDNVKVLSCKKKNGRCAGRSTQD